MAESDFMLINLLIKEEENTHELFKNQLVTGIGQLNLTCNVIDTTIYTFQPPVLSIQPIADKFQFQQKFQLDSTSSVLEQKLNEMKYRPQLNVYGTTGYYSSNLANLYRNIGVSGGIHFTMPIYDGHQRKNVEKQIQLEMNSQQISRDYSARQLSSTLYYLMQQIQATQSSIRLINERLQMHKTVLGILKDKMMLGQTSVMDYILSVQEYATTFQNKALSEANLLSLINNYNYINW